MKKRLIASLLVLPFLASAQTGDIPPEGVGLYCPTITQNLQFKDCDSGSTRSSCKRYVDGAQVTELQKFLADYYDLDYEENVSGYFGARTLQNVQRFQKDNNLTPPAGYVGPMTRAKIQALCGGTKTPSTSQNHSCTTPWGSNIAHNSTILAYQNYTVPVGQSCMSQDRTCMNGILSGSYQYNSCTVSTNTGTCTPLPPENRIQSCPAGQTGSVFQTRTSMCLFNATTPNWSEWTTTANTCVTTSTTPQCPAVQQPNGTTCTTTAGAPGTWHYTTINGCPGWQCLATQTTPNTASCTTPWGTTVVHNASVTAYQSPEDSGIGCVSEQRMCTNGSLSGNYRYATCTQYPSTTYSWVTGEWGSCATNQQTRTVQCKNNTGTVVGDWYCGGTKPVTTQSCSSTISGKSSIAITPTYGPAPLTIRIKDFFVDWQDILNTRADSLPITDAKLTVDYGDGSAALRVSAGCSQGTGCRGTVNNIANNTHVYTNSGTYIIRLLVRDIEVARTQVSVSQNIGGSNPSGTTLYAVTPLSGKAPLAVSFFVKYSENTAGVTPKIYFGDGDSSSVPKGLFGISPEIIHVYSTAGTYTAYTQGGYVTLPHGSATIVVTDPTASTQNESQLASTYTALESALRALLGLLQ